MQIVLKFESGEAIDITKKTPKEVEKIIETYGERYVIYHLKTKIGGAKNE